MGPPPFTINVAIKAVSPLVAPWVKPEGEEEKIVDGAKVFDEDAEKTFRAHLVTHLDSGATSVLEVDGTCTGATYIPTEGGEELWTPPESVTRVDATQLFGDATLPYPDQSFDAVVLASAAELLTDPQIGRAHV